MRQGFAFFDTQQTCEEAFLKLSGHKLDNGWSLRLRAKDRETSRKQAPSIMAVRNYLGHASRYDIGSMSETNRA